MQVFKEMKISPVKVAGFLSATATAVYLALSGQTVEAVGIIAAALSSSQLTQK